MLEGIDYKIMVNSTVFRLQCIPLNKKNYIIIIITIVDVIVVSIIVRATIVMTSESKI